MTDSSNIATTVGASVANKTTYTGALTGVVGWWTQIDLISVIGLSLAVIGFFFNLYFQYRRDKREEQESAARTRREEIESAARLRVLEIQQQKEKING